MLAQTTPELMNSSSARLDLLAVELQARIVALLDPKDVIALRQTCRALFLMSRDRLTWLKVLRAVRFERKLFLPERTMINMTTRELEDAACGRDKWLSLATRNPIVDKTLQPLARHTISPPMVLEKPPHPRGRFYVPSRAIAKVHKIRLTPGGHFLVVWTAGWLSVYQIITGIRLENQSGTMCPVASVLIEAMECHEMLVQTAHDGERLRVSLHFTTNKYRYKYNVYEVDFKADTLALRLVASTGRPRLGPRSQARGLSGDILLIHQAGEFILWNFVENTWACWLIPLPECTYIRDAENIFLTSTCVILICVDQIAFWKIPTLHHLPSIGTPSFTYQNLDPSQIYLEPDVVCALPDPLFECSAFHGWSWCAPDQWQPEQSLSSNFLGIQAVIDENHDLCSPEEHFWKDDTFIRLKPDLMRHVDDTISHSTSALNVSLFMHPEINTPLRFCSESYLDKCISVQRDHGVELSLPHVQACGSEEMSNRVITFIPTGHLISDICPQFSPASGRMVLVKDDHEQTVEIWDFLP